MERGRNSLVWVLAFFTLCALAVTGYVVSLQGADHEGARNQAKAVRAAQSIHKTRKARKHHPKRVAPSQQSYAHAKPARPKAVDTRRPGVVARAVYYPRPRRQANYTRDLAECRMYARQVAGYTPEETVKGGLLGGAVGAAAGAAIGAVLGHAGKGAAIGAAAGGIGGGTYSAIEAERRYKKAYARCMRQRGYRVLN